MLTLTRPRQDAIAARYEAVHGRIAKRLAAHLRAFFRVQARRVVARYEARRGIKTAEAQPEEDFLPRDEEDALLIALEVYLLTMLAITSELAAALAGGTAFTADSLAARALLAEMGNPARQITDASRRAIRRHLVVGAAAGYSPRAIVSGVLDDDYPSLGGLVESSYAGRAEAIAATETARIGALTIAETYRMAGVERVLIRDGLACGWDFHESRDKADGSVRLLSEYRATPLSHPFCIRLGYPILGRSV